MSLLSLPLSALTRTDYRAVHGMLSNGWVVLRAWSEAGEPRCLAVDPATLEVSVVSGNPDSVKGEAPQKSTYELLRTAVRERRDGVQNAGLRVGRPQRTGAWLTFDLCPSTHPLDRDLFRDLETDASPLPVFLEVSGRWMATHPADLSWLIEQRDAGLLEITWVNHTENHNYRPGVPLKENFLLLPGTDLDAEVFTVEQRLLERGELPSVFFRFPGLVSSPELVDRVLALGLIPLGSSAWLAKQQSVKNGAVVLTHANGNEPEGLEILERWDHRHRPDLFTGAWHWLDERDWVGAAPPAP